MLLLIREGGAALYAAFPTLPLPPNSYSDRLAACVAACSGGMGENDHLYDNIAAAGMSLRLGISSVR